MTARTLSVPGISCEHCKMSIEQAVGDLAGVERRGSGHLGPHGRLELRRGRRSISTRSSRQSKKSAMRFRAEQRRQFGPQSRPTPADAGTLRSSDTLVFDVEGMTCASCAVRVERVLARQPGVDNASVNFAGGRARVRASSDTDPAELRTAVQKIGYDIALADPAQPSGIADRYAAEARIQWRRFWLAAALSLPAMVLGMAAGMSDWSMWAQALLTTPVVLVIGAPFHRMAWKQARVGTAGMDTLISLGSLTAYGWSWWAMFNHQDVFFETAADHRHPHHPRAGHSKPRPRVGPPDR